eukprot:ANDGO_05468.mRNA.1 putative cation-transporting ATPase C1672.11c
MIGYVPSPIKRVFFYVLSVLTLGVLPIAASSRPRLYAKLLLRRVALPDATLVLVSSEDIPDEQSAMSFSSASTVQDGLCPVQILEVPNHVPSLQFAHLFCSATAVRKPFNEPSSRSGSEPSAGAKGPYHRATPIVVSDAEQQLPLVDETAGGLSAAESVAATGSLQLVRFIRFQGIRIVFDWTTGRYVIPRADFIELISTSNVRKGLSAKEHLDRLLVYGANALNIKDPRLSAKTIFLTELSHPFYAFQFVAAAIWFLSPGYYPYAFEALFCVLVFLYIRFRHAYKYLKRLKKMVVSNTEIHVVRQGQSFITGSSSLVPGDIIELNMRMRVPCDAALLQGSVSADESSLTGDPSLLQKTALRGLRGEGIPAEHLLYSGTHIAAIQNDATENGQLVPARAIVLNTGFYTLRGEMIRKSLYKRVVGSPYEHEAFLWAIIMIGVFAISTIGAFASLHVFLSNLSTYEIVLLALDTNAVALQPVYLVSFTMAVIFAAVRLKKKQIYSMNTDSVVSFGRVDCVMIDKTGTLTSHDFSLKEFKPSNLFSSPAYPRMTSTAEQVQHCELLPSQSQSQLFSRESLICMAACQSLVFPRTANVMGDPLERECFTCTQFECFQDTNSLIFRSPSWFDPQRRYFLRKLTSVVFSIADRLTGTVVEVKTSNTAAPKAEKETASTAGEGSSSGADKRSIVERWVVLKAEASKILPHLSPEGTPADFESALHSLGLQGYRLVAYAMKKLEAHSPISAEADPSLFADLKLVGIAVLENSVRPDSAQVVEHLSRSAIRTYLVSGDVTSTCIAVARKCRIIDSTAPILLGKVVSQGGSDAYIEWIELEDGGPGGMYGSSVSTSSALGERGQFKELVLTGDVLEFLLGVRDQSQRFLLAALLCRCRVYAQISPEQKALLVQFFETELQFYVGYVGDGSNDVLAFSATTASLALSENPTSTICASFHSSTVDNGKVSAIGSIVRLIREGRGAIANMVQTFKFMVVSSILMFVSTVFMFKYGISGLSETQTAWITLFHVLPLAFLSPLTAAYPKISRLRPPGSLFSLQVVVSFAAQSLVHIIFLVSVIVWATSKSFNTARKSESLNDIDSVANTVMFMFSIFQYLILGFVFNISKPFRKPLLRNVGLVAFYIFLLSLDLYILLSADSGIQSSLDLVVCTTVECLDGREGVPLSFRYYMLILVVACFVTSFVVEKGLMIILESQADESAISHSGRKCNTIMSYLSKSKYIKNLEREKCKMFVPWALKNRSHMKTS